MKGNNTCRCGRKCMEEKCWICVQRERQKQIVTSVCRICGSEFGQRKRAFDDLKRKGVLPVCVVCRYKERGVWLKELRAKQTPEERLKLAKLARSSVKADTSETVRKQWRTIRNDPEKWKKAKDRLKGLSVSQWKTISDEDRDRRIKAFMGTHGKPRSKGNEELKQMMVEDGLYDGFVSEEMFKGFIPDEINHNLRIVVEYYGDVYHCNPMRYRDAKQYIPVIQRTVGEQWARDRKRLAVFYRYGYSVVIVWEKDFQRDPKKEIGRIRDEVGKKREAVGIVRSV